MADTPTLLRDAVEIGAMTTATACTLVLVLALVAELVRRRRGDAAVVRLADRLLPTPTRRIAVAALALLSTVAAVAGPRAAAATEVGPWVRAGDRTATTPAPESGPSAAELPDGRAQDEHGTVREWLDPTTDATDGRTASDTESTTRDTPSPPATGATRAPPAPPTRVVRDPGTAAPTDPRSSSPHAPSTPSAQAGPDPTTPSSTGATSPRADDPPGIPAPTPTAPAPATSTYTVAPGDCLWSIAARLLGPGATGQAVDRGWRAIHVANQAAVGDDPGLIHPGLVLTIPALDATP